MISPQHVYTAFDVETTGLVPDVDRIIEITLIALDRNGRELAVFDTLVDPGSATGVGRPDIHGIAEPMVAAAPTWEQIADLVGAVIAGTVPVAHYAKFDMGFLNAEMDRAARPLPPLASICTIDAARAAGLEGPFGLAHVAPALGVELGTHHRALDDTRATATVFRRLLLRGRIQPSLLARVRHARPEAGAFPDMPAEPPSLVARQDADAPRAEAG